MRDAALLLVVVWVASTIGLPIARLLPENGFRDRLLAAPALGIAALGAGMTIAYRYGIHPPALMGGFVVAAAAASSRWAVRIVDRRGALVTAGIGVALAVVLLLPAWVGGPAFELFQANPYDQVEYQNMAMAYAKTGYADLHRIPTDPALAGSYDRATLSAANELRFRPAVSIVYAAFFPLIASSTVDAAYGYMLATQVASAFAVAFLLRQISLLGVGPAVAIGGLFVAGFWGQYVLDINAWGLLSGMPAAVTVFALTLATMRERSADRNERAKTSLVFALALGGLLYLYPECSPVYAVACLVAVVALLLRSKGGVLAGVTTLAAGVAGAVSIAALDVEGSLGSLLNQVGKGSAPREWAWFYHAYVTRLPATWDGLGSCLRNLAYVADGLLGLYPVAPSSTTPVAWAVLDLALAIAVLFCAATTWLGRSRAMAAGVIGALAFAFAIVLSGRWWEGGKAFSMASPIWFCALVLPLTLARRRILMVPALVLLAVQAGYAFDRVVRAPGDVFRAWPDADFAYLKRNIEFDPDSWRAALVACPTVRIDIEGQAAREMVTLYLRQSDLAPRILPGDRLAACRVVDREVPSVVGERVVDLRRQDGAKISQR